MLASLLLLLGCSWYEPLSEPHWERKNDQDLYVIHHQTVAILRHAPVSEYIWGVEFTRLPEPVRYFSDKVAAQKYVERWCRRGHCLTN